MGGRTRAWLLAALALAAAAGASCKKSEDASTSNAATTGESTISAGGTWVASVAITATDPGGCGGNRSNSKNVSLTITDSNGALSGSYNSGGSSGSFSGTRSTQTVTVTFAGTTCGGTGTGSPSFTGTLFTSSMTLTAGGTSCEPCTQGVTSTERPWTLSSAATTFTKQ